MARKGNEPVVACVGLAMEELQCALLGLGSSAWATHSGVSVSPELKSLLHPTEYQLIVETLPLGSAARTLREYASAVRAGRHDGYLASAVGLAISDVLDEYDDMVLAADSVAKVDALRSRLLESFQSLVRITHHAREPEVLALLIHNFVTKLDLDEMVRERLGTAVATSVLYVVAHYVAHGAVLEGRRHDFFIVAASAASSGGGGPAPQARTDDAALGRDDDAIPLQPSSLTFRVNKRLLPCGIPVELADTILAAGQERHLLKHQLQSRELTSHFDGQRDDDVCRRIHASLFNASLVIEGHLSLEELQIRVEAARQLWSRSLWMLVRQESRLSATVQALYDHYLGHRGDVWGTFAMLSFSTLASLHSRAAGRPGSELPIARAVEANFRQALRACQLEDDHTNAPVFLKMDTVSPVANCSLEEVPQVVLSRISLLMISVDLPVGVSLIIGSVHLERYRELFEFQMVHRYAMHALHDARRGVGQLLKLAAATGYAAHDTPTHPSSSLSTALSFRQFLSRLGVVLHFYTFVISTVNSYFQLDACESHYAQLVQTLEHRCHSVAEARAAHEHFLFSVCDTIFSFDDSNALQQTIRSAATSAFQLWALVRLLVSRSSDARLSSETLGCLAQLERQQSEFTITITSLVATSTKAHERSLWIRLDFNRFLSNAWSRGSAAASGAGGGSRRGTHQVGAPISLAGLRVPQATVSVVKLASTPIAGSQARLPEPSVRDF